MKRCVLLTARGIETRDDQALSEHLRSLGWDVSLRTWTESLDSEGAETTAPPDIVVIRSTWDYHHRTPEFLDVLAQLAARTHLENPHAIIRWNSCKTYLADLAAQGVPIVPTLYFEPLTLKDVEEAFETFGAEIVVKPQVSASADGTFRLSASEFAESGFAESGFAESGLAPSGLAASWPEIEAALAGRPSMCQPLVHNVLEEGEYSLVFFAGEFSHAVLKTPNHGDYRVQDEFGGTALTVHPESDLVTAADEAIRAAMAVVPSLDGRPPLYARVDVARSNERVSTWWLMELELIEPELFLATDEHAAERFARAIDERVRKAN